MRIILTFRDTGWVLLVLEAWQSNILNKSSRWRDLYTNWLIITPFLVTMSEESIIKPSNHQVTFGKGFPAKNAIWINYSMDLWLTKAINHFWSINIINSIITFKVWGQSIAFFFYFIWFFSFFYIHSKAKICSFEILIVVTKAQSQKSSYDLFKG